MSSHLYGQVGVKRVLIDGTNARLAAGTSAATSEAIDLRGYDGALFILGIGAITSGGVQSIKLQQSDVSGSGYADLEGTSQSIADTDDDKTLIGDLNHPEMRYVKTVITRATQNSAFDGLWVVKYGPRDRPVADDAGNIGNEFWLSPEEGDA